MFLSHNSRCKERKQTSAYIAVIFNMVNPWKLCMRISILAKVKLLVAFELVKCLYTEKKETQYAGKVF